MTKEKSDLAFDATFRQAAPHQIRREHKNVALAIESHDLRKKVRVRRAANLILFVVDASWSMAAAERMTATKGAIMSLLIDAYQKRDRVGLVVFQKEDARLVLPPTSSVDLAQKLLKDIPVGGKTPLSAGLVLAHQVLVRERARDREVMPLMIIVTDGAGNVSMTDLPPQEEATRVAAMIKIPSTKRLTAGWHSTSPIRSEARAIRSSSCGLKNFTRVCAKRCGELTRVGRSRNEAALCVTAPQSAPRN